MFSEVISERIVLDLCLQGLPVTRFGITVAHIPTRSVSRWVPAKGRREAWGRPGTFALCFLHSLIIFEGPHPCLMCWLIAPVMTCFSYGNSIALISLLQQCLWFSVYTLILLPKGRWGRNQRSRPLNRCISMGASLFCLYALLAIVA